MPGMPPGSMEGRAVGVVVDGVPQRGFPTPSGKLEFFSRTLYDWGVCLRRAGDYGLRWYETPFALATAAAVRVLEVPGMVHALRGRPLPETAFR